MQTITFEISNRLQHMLSAQGITSETAMGTFLEQLVRAYADDLMLGESALAAKAEGYIGTDASVNVLSDMTRLR